MNVKSGISISISASLFPWEMLPISRIFCSFLPAWDLKTFYPARKSIFKIFADMDECDGPRFCSGKKRMQPVGIIVFAAIMATLGTGTHTSSPHSHDCHITKNTSSYLQNPKKHNTPSLIDGCVGDVLHLPPHSSHPIPVQSFQPPF